MEIEWITTIELFPKIIQAWPNEAAGNRASDYTGSSWTYDHLNRMTSNGAGTSLTNDILGNRTALGSSISYGWDCLNRMISYNGGTAYSYAYRADGMRVSKTQSSNVDRYRYDGQMPMETFVTKSDSSTVLTENGLGARGLDYTAVTTSSGTSVVFPIFDAHGNEVASLARSGSSYSLSNQRSYGAWGEIRQGATTGGPRGRYCANLGHVQDDETSLVYMRARYYEAGSGRFISEDPDCKWINWFDYSNNDPVDYADATGRSAISGICDICDALLGLNSSAGNINSAYGIGSGGLGLQALLEDLHKTKDASVVEADWGVFMESWKSNPIDMLDSSGDLGLLLGIFDTASGLMEEMPWGTIMNGISEGTQLVVLALAYQARIEWYIQDIDSD